MPKTRSISKEDKRSDNSRRKSLNTANLSTDHESGSNVSPAAQETKRSKTTKRKSVGNTDAIDSNAEIATCKTRKITKGKTSKASKSNDKDWMVPFSYEKTTWVEFIEDGNRMSMSVDDNSITNSASTGQPNKEVSDEEENEDLVDYEDDDYDQEVSFKDTTINSDDESTVSSEIKQEGEYSSGVRSMEEEENRQTNEADRWRKMLELDQEIKVKFRELKSIMEEGGLQGAAKEADEVFRLYVWERYKQKC